MRIKLFSCLLNISTLILLSLIAIGSFSDFISLPYEKEVFNQEWISIPLFTSIIKFIIYGWFGTVITSLAVTQLAKLFNIKAHYSVWISFHKI